MKEILHLFYKFGFEVFFSAVFSNCNIIFSVSQRAGQNDDRRMV